jgi:hypothetical protein
LRVVSSLILREGRWTCRDSRGLSSLRESSTVRGRRIAL